MAILPIENTNTLTKADRSKTSTPTPSSNGNGQNKKKKQSLKDFLSDTSFGEMNWADDDYDPSTIALPTFNTNNHTRNYYHDNLTYQSNSYSEFGSNRFSHNQHQHQYHDMSGPNSPPYIVKLTNIPSFFGIADIEDLFHSRFMKYLKLKVFWEINYEVLSLASDPLEALNRQKKVAFVELHTPQDLNKVLNWRDLYLNNGLGRVMTMLGNFQDFKTYNDIHQRVPEEDDPSVPLNERKLHQPRRPMNPPQHNIDHQFQNNNRSQHSQAHNEQLQRDFPVFQQQQEQSAAPPQQQQRRKSNPFGSAKPVDTLSKELELENKLHELEINKTTFRTLGHDSKFFPIPKHHKELFEDEEEGGSKTKQNLETKSAPNAAAADVVVVNEQKKQSKQTPVAKKDTPKSKSSTPASQQPTQADLKPAPQPHTSAWGLTSTTANIIKPSHELGSPQSGTLELSRPSSGSGSKKMNSNGGNKEESGGKRKVILKRKVAQERKKQGQDIKSPSTEPETGSTKEGLSVLEIDKKENETLVVKEESKNETVSQTPQPQRVNSSSPKKPSATPKLAPPLTFQPLSSTTLSISNPELESPSRSRQRQQQQTQSSSSSPSRQRSLSPMKRAPAFSSRKPVAVAVVGDERVIAPVSTGVEVLKLVKKFEQETPKANDSIEKSSPSKSARFSNGKQNSRSTIRDIKEEVPPDTDVASVSSTRSEKENTKATIRDEAENVSNRNDGSSNTRKPRSKKPKRERNGAKPEEVLSKEIAASPSVNKSISAVEQELEEFNGLDIRNISKDKKPRTKRERKPRAQTSKTNDVGDSKDNVLPVASLIVESTGTEQEKIKSSKIRLTKSKPRRTSKDFTNESNTSIPNLEAEETPVVIESDSKLQSPPSPSKRSSKRKSSTIEQTTTQRESKQESKSTTNDQDSPQTGNSTEEHLNQPQSTSSRPSSSSYRRGRGSSRGGSRGGPRGGFSSRGRGGPHGRFGNVSKVFNKANSTVETGSTAGGVSSGVEGP